MKRSEFTKAMAKKGWVLWRHEPGSRMTSYVCRNIGCRGVHLASDDAIFRGDVPSACRKRHKRGYAGKVVDSHEALQMHLTKRRHRLGLSQEQVEAAAGLTPDHIGKLEIHQRAATFPTYWAWAETLGFDIVLVPKPLPDSVLAIIDHKAGQPVPSRHPPACLLMPSADSSDQSLTWLEDIA